jgi:excinuclease ABC subunit A
VIRNADWVIDLGPEGGEEGGQIVAEGIPARVAATLGSHTGEFLRRYFPPSALLPFSVNGEEHSTQNGALAPRAAKSVSRKKKVAASRAR